MTKTKYNLEFEVDSSGRKRVDLSDLSSFPRDLVYTSGSNPVYEIDMAVPSVYNFFLSHTGTVQFRLMNLQADRNVTVNLILLAASDRFFSIADDKGSVLGPELWAEGIVLDKVAATKTYLVSVRNYGDGINSVMINWMKKG